MARHTPLDVANEIIRLLSLPSQMSYLTEPITIYEDELQDILDSGETVDGPRIWVMFNGSDYVRSDLDNAWVHNEVMTFDVIIVDSNYGGSNFAASGDEFSGNNPGTLRMSGDVMNRIVGQKPFQEACPFLPVELKPIRTSTGRRISAYNLSIRTEFDWGAPATAVAV